MKDSVLQMLDEGTQLRMAQEFQEPEALPVTLKTWPPEKVYEAPQFQPSKRPLFLMFLLMGILTAFFYVKFYM